ncbi:MAG: rod shape-determining protein MreC [Phycisphaerales bacterium JB063]
MLTDTTTRRILIALTVVFLVNSQLNTRHIGWVGKVPNAIVKTLANPPASLMRSVTARVKGTPAEPTHVDQTQGLEERNRMFAMAQLENRRLSEENAELRRQLSAYQAAAAVRGSETIRLIEAIVADRNPSRSNPTLELDKGTRAGVQPGNPVIVAADLVGFVSSDVGTLRCAVQLVTVPKARYQVRLLAPASSVQPDDEPVYVYADTTGEFFYCDLPDGQHDVRVGDIASMADDLYHQAYGYILGEVTEVNDDHPDDPLALDRIIIRPSVQFGRLRDVMIQVQE